MDQLSLIVRRGGDLRLWEKDCCCGADGGKGPCLQTVEWEYAGYCVERTPTEVVEHQTSEEEHICNV